MTVHTGKNVEKGEHFSIAGGSKNLYSHYRNQFGVSSENWESIPLLMILSGAIVQITRKLKNIHFSSFAFLVMKYKLSCALLLVSESENKIQVSWFQT